MSCQSIILLALTHPKRLHRMYIAAYDERNKQILHGDSSCNSDFRVFAYLCFDCSYMPLSIFSCPMLQSYQSCSMA